MANQNETLSITNETKGKLPRLPLVLMKDTILGKKYELSLVIATPKTSRTLNRKYRGKDKPTNILSFSLGEKSGEIIIELGEVKKSAPDFHLSAPKFLAYLLIHGMLHLKGHVHGSTMEKQEKGYGKKLGIEIPEL